MNSGFNHSEEFHSFCKRLNNMFEFRSGQIDKVLSLLQGSQSYSDLFDITLQRLNDRLSQVSQLDLLSTLATGSQLSFGFDADNSELSNPERLQQCQLELLQAFILRNEECLEKKRPVFDPDLEDVYDCLITLFIVSMLSRIREPENRAELEKFVIVESMRLQTQALRNWAYPQQIRRITQEIFKELDYIFERKYNINSEKLVGALFSLVSTIEDRLNVLVNHGQSVLIRIFSSTTKQAALDALRAAFAEGTAESLIQKCQQEPAVTVDAIKNMALSLYREKLNEAYVFTLEDVAVLVGLPSGSTQLKSIMDFWSLKPGQLREINPKDLILANPVSSKPFICLPNQKYVCPVPGIVISSCMQLMEQLACAEGADAKAKYHDARGRIFLQREAKRLLQMAFPDAEIASSVEGPEKKLGENDLVVLISPYLVICECKGHQPNDEAKRGAVKSLKATVQRMIEHPNLQSFRLETWLKNNPGIHQFSSAEGPLTIDTALYPYIVRFSTCLENLPGRLGSWRSLVEAKLVDSNLMGIPTIPIADLECVFSILDTKAERLHYLVRRNELENEFPIYEDEIGLLYQYLQNSLAQPLSPEFAKIPLLEAMSETLDEYFMQEWTNEVVPKPKHHISDWTREVIYWLEPHTMGIRLSCLLLSLSIEQQTELELRTLSMLERVKNSKQEEKVNNVVRLSFVAENCSSVLMLVGMKDIDEPDLFLKSIALETNMSTNPKDLFCIGIDVCRPNYPFEVFVALLNR